MGTPPSHEARGNRKFKVKYAAKSSLSRLLCIGSRAAALHQKYGEVRGERLSGKLPHH
jgi:hypothetical protein